MALSKQHKMVGTTQRIGERIGQGGNMLDSSAPTKRRGKEREIPKAKKPSALRKVRLTLHEMRVAQMTTRTHLSLGNNQRERGTKERS